MRPVRGITGRVTNPVTSGYYEPPSNSNNDKKENDSNSNSDNANHN